MHARRRLPRRLVAALLGAMLLAQTAFVPVSAADPIDPSPAPAAISQAEPGTSPSSGIQPAAEPEPTPPTDGVERPDLRTETSLTYEKSDGTRVAELYSDPINYKDTTGAWLPIDLDFKEVGADDKGVVVRESPTQLRVAPPSDSAGFLTVAIGGWDIHLHSVEPPTPRSSDARPKVAGSAADVEDVLPGIDLRVSASATGVNSFFILDKEHAKSVLAFELDAPGLVPSLDRETGVIALADPKGVVVASVLAPYAVDSTPDEFTGGGRVTSDVRYALENVDGRYLVTVTVDPTWLAKATYPVYVDPNIYNDGYTSFGDAHVNQGNANLNYANYQRPDSPGYYEMWLGESPSDSSYYNEAYIKFNLSTIEDKTIDSANLEVRPYHQYYNSPTATTTWLRQVATGSSNSWAENTIKWSNKPNVVATAIDTTGCVEGAQCAFAMTTLVRNWVNGSVDNNGVRLDENGNGPTYWKRLIAAEEQTSTRPRLVVTYHNPVVSTTTGTAWTNSRDLAWTYSDASSHAQTHYEVDVDTSSSFTVPLDHDGPETAGADTTFSIPGGVSLTDGTTYHWRVRVKDGTSWSAWDASSIQWDAAAPTGGSISVNSGATYATSTSATLNLAATDAHSGGIQMQPSNDGSTGTWTTFSASPSWTLPGSDGTKTVYVRYRDGVGNTTSWLNDTIVLDTVNPSATVAIDNGATTTYSQSVTLNIASSDATSGVATTKASNDNSTFTTVTGPAASWSLTAGDGTKTVWFQVIDSAGRITTVSDTITLATDITPPGAPSTPDLSTASDSGASSTDDVTSDGTPTFTGTAEANSTITIYDGVTAKGSAAADGSGAWSVTTSTLTDGVHSITAKATDAASNISPASSALSVTIDTTAPSAPTTLDLVAGSDSGSSSSDDITNDSTPTITGSAEADATVSVRDDGTPVGTGSSVSGTWTITTSSLAGGARTITATATDVAGNTSSASSALTVTVDTTAPAAPSTPDLDAGSDTGGSDTDDITNDPTPTLSGTGETGTTVTLSDGTSAIGSGSTAAGAWSITSTALTDGTIEITATATDTAGNTSSPSAALAIDLDTEAPTTPGTPDLDATADSGASDSDDVTNDPTPLVVGSAAEGDAIELVDDSAVVAAGTAGPTGYALTTSNLAEGAHELTARTVDIAGNASASTATLEITVDTTAPEVAFTSPTGFATQPVHEFEIAWTEDGTGSDIDSRSIQRRSAAAVVTEDCDDLTFVDDAEPTSLAGPRQDENLADSTCYAWRATVDDVAGNQVIVTSAAIQTNLSGTVILRLRAAPSAAVGATVYASVAIEDGAGQPKDDYTGTLTIASTDTGAVYPDGTTGAVTHANKEEGRTFRVRFSDAGTYDLSVSGPGATGSTAAITITDAALRLAAPATVYAGVPFKLAVIPRVTSKTTGPLNRAYAATVTFSSSDPDPDFGQEVDGSNEYTFVCNCDGAHVFATTLSETGSQTVTVTDEFGVTDTITVDVDPASGGGSATISNIDVVQWPQGNTIDYYITASGPFQVLSVADNCGLSNRALSSSSAGLGAGTTGGRSISRLVADPASSIHSGVLPAVALAVDEEYTEGSLRLATETGACGAGNFGDGDGYTFTYTDGAGHLFTKVAGKHRTFGAITGDEHFVRQGPDTPVIAYSTISRGGTASSTFTDPNTGGQIRYIPGGLVMGFELRAPITIYRIEFLTSGLGTYNLGPGYNTYKIPAGESTVVMNDVPYHNSCLMSQELNPGRIYYTGPGGRTGMISGTGVWPGSTFPNPGPPTGWGCDGTQGEPQPPEPNDALRDAFEKLGLDDVLGVADTVNGLSHMTMGDPVDVSTGAQLGETTDFALGGRTPALSLTRHYRSDVAEAVANGGTPAARADGLLGIGWATNLDWKLDIDPAGDQIVVRGDAVGAVTFRKLDDDTWSGPEWLRMNLVADGSEWLLTRPLGDGYRFDGDGRLEAVVDPQGHTMTLSWDGSDHLEGFTDAAGREAEVTTNGAGHITRIDLPDGRYVTYGYSGAGFLTSVRMLDGETMSYVVDDRGRITKIKDPLNRTVLTSVYDGRGRVVRQSDALGQTTRFAYDRVNQVTLTYGPRGGVTMTCVNPDGTTAATLDALGGTREYTYDEAGRPLSFTDELGQRTRYRYDSDGNPTHVIDALGQAVVTDYDAKGRPVEIVGIDGATTTTTYDPTTGGPETVTRTDGIDVLDVATYAYNAIGLPDEIGEPGGATTLLHYDADGYLDASTDAEGRETTFETDARGFVTSEVGPLGNAPGGVPADHTTVRTFDAAGRVLTVTDPLDATWTYGYDEMGRLLTVESPLGALTTNMYDVKGQLVSATRTLTGSLDATTTYEYDAAGNLTAIEDPEDRRTEFEYDLLDRRVVTRDAEDAEWLVDYDAAGQVVAETDPTGRTIETAYDAAGRVTSTTDAAGQSTTYGYDAAGRLETITDPLDHVTTYGYDWMGRPEAVTNALDDTASVEFDAAGDVISVTNARGKTTEFEYDATHRLTLVTEPGGIETSYAYDDAGRLESRTNDRGATESYDYDANGRLTVLTDTATETWTTTYDDDGRIESTIDGEGQTIDYAFDLVGRLLSLTPDVGDPITFSYDDADRLDAMTDGAGTTSYGYDAVGRLTTSARAGRTTTYVWDDAGRPASVTYPASAGTVNYAYDTAGRIESISDWASRTTTYTYDAASRVTDIERPGDLLTEIAYDALDRPLDVDHSVDGTPTLSQAYTYDENGNLATYGDDAGSATFTYDDLDRLTQAAFPSSQTYTYGYDSVGNLTSATKPGAGTTTLAYDLADRITTSGYTYDANGALTADPTRTYAYDAFGRLASSTVGATTTTYTLDGAGRRLAETTGVTTTSFDLDLRAPLATILADGTRTYLPGDPAAGYAQGGTWYSALTDQLGSAHSTISQSGVQSAITRWDPHGAARPGSSVGAGIGYAGEWRDPTGLIDLRARAYDPALGRFTSRDPFGGLAQAPQTANRYSYALNGPYRYADPSGHFVTAVYANAPMLVSLGIQMTPGIGDAYSALTGLVGFDPIAGVSLSDGERALAIGSAFAIGGGLHLLGRLGDGVADSATLGRATDGMAGARGDVVYRALRPEEVAGVRAGLGIRRPASRVPPVAHINNYAGVRASSSFVSTTRSELTARRFAAGRNPGSRAEAPIIAIDLGRVSQPIFDVSTVFAAERVLGTGSPSARNAAELAANAQEVLIQGGVDASAIMGFLQTGGLR